MHSVIWWAAEATAQVKLLDFVVTILFLLLRLDF